MSSVKKTCRFGASCNRKDTCPFDHSQGDQTDNAQICKYGLECKNKDTTCKRRHLAKKKGVVKDHAYYVRPINLESVRDRMLKGLVAGNAYTLAGTLGYLRKHLDHVAQELRLTEELLREYDSSDAVQAVIAKNVNPDDSDSVEFDVSELTIQGDSHVE